MNKSQVSDNPSFIFFGTPDLAVSALEGLAEGGLKPTCIITAPDKPTGRKQVLTPTPVKLWALEHNIPVLTPAKIDDGFLYSLQPTTYNLFIVAAYGKILPQKLLDLPKHGTLNIHPSLLPLYRGPAPVIGPILAGDTKTGVTVIKIDAKVDHGPILAQEEIFLDGNEKAPELGNRLFYHGGELLAQILPKYLEGTLPLQEQDHSQATFTKKLKKEDGLVNLATEPPSELWRKYRAYFGWPGIYFLDTPKPLSKGEGGHHDHKVDFARSSVVPRRIKITQASFTDGVFTIEKVIPEGKKEMSYEFFLKTKSL